MIKNVVRFFFVTTMAVAEFLQAQSLHRCSQYYNVNHTTFK